MRRTHIASGLLRGREIDIPEKIRPTQEKIRKAIFDILQQEIKGVSFLELYAGSGAVGIEALSNAAGKLVFVDNDIRCCKIIESNLNKLLQEQKEDISKDVEILVKDAISSIDLLSKQNKKFDIIFLDPPYFEGLTKKTLQRLSAYDILSPQCLVIVEHSKKDNLEKEFSNLTLFKQKRYGDTVLSFYKNKI